MRISDEQIDFIAADLKSRGVDLEELNESLVDHIACSIEESGYSDFNKAYTESLNKFDKFKPKDIQKETILLINLTKTIAMKITMFLLGYLSVILVTTGLLFKIMHWPGANVMLVLGIGLLNFGFLPMFFIRRYKSSISE